jgi:hypothetical protein
MAERRLRGYRAIGFELARDEATLPPEDVIARPSSMPPAANVSPRS